MASSSTPSIVEGVFAISKPPAISSAQVIRDAQEAFKSSKLFAPWLEREQARKDAESHNQKQKRRSWKQRQPMQLKMGHGGTLDPMATGVLILGVGSGTKSLNKFLECTKSYECVLLFGAATDSYDAVGKLVAKKPFEHVTKKAVEKALEQFRGDIMQVPSAFSALKVNGKKMYEYARAGEEIPNGIKARPVEVKQLEMVEWMEGGTHEWRWPEEEAPKEVKEVAEKVMQLRSKETRLGGDSMSESTTAGKRGHDDTVDDSEEASSKRAKLDASTPLEPSEASAEEATPGQSSSCPAPACRLKMTVTSGFYVRSLCHDLGMAVDSLGLMSSLVRTRQADFELGKNVLDYDDLAGGEDVWGPKVATMLEEWEAAQPQPSAQGDGDKQPNRSTRTRDEPASRKRRNSSSGEE